MADVVVVGGGPSGLATAIALRRVGLGCLVVDKSRPPIDKPCGEGIMPAGIAALASLGVRVAPDEARPFRGIRYIDSDTGGAEPRIAEGAFPAEPGLGIRRTVLSRRLVEAAEAAGVEFAWGTRVVGLAADGVETDAGTIAARWVVAADGLNSKVRRWAGLAPVQRAAAPGARYGVRRHFAVEPWTDWVEVHWSRSAEAYVTPVGPREVGVNILASRGELRFDRLMERFPQLAPRLAEAPHISETRGAGPFRQKPPALSRGRVVLVGDASGYLDPITGEGISLALAQAQALARALAADDLHGYAREHARIIAGYWRTTSLLLFLQRHPRLRRRAVHALGASRGVFSRILAVHYGAAPPWHIGVGGAARLVGNFLHG